MTKLTDRASLGFLTFQDHAAERDGTPLGKRMCVAAARIAEFPRREDSDQPIRYAQDRQLGTLGDVHPWMFWQTRGRTERAMGSWSQLFAGMVTNGDANYGAAGVQPWRRNWLTDRRYYLKNAGVAAGMPWYPEGAMVIFTAGTDEDQQYEHAMWADPRLLAPNADGPGEMGTLVCDFGPPGTICMARSDEPGIGGRHARLQSLLRVIAVPEQQSFAEMGARGNTIALNFARSGADGIPNFGAAFGLVDGRGGGGGPITGGGSNTQSGPSTGEASGAGRGGRNLDDVVGDESVGGDPFGDAITGNSSSDGFGPADVGRFRKNREAGHGIGLMAAMGAMGPFHIGADGDKHRIGEDADGHTINSMHISTEAYYYRDGFFDAPLLFEPSFFPQPPGFPNKARTHLAFDEKARHPFLDGTRVGYWRWWTEIPDMAPKKPPPITPRPPIAPPPPKPPKKPPPSGPPTQPPTKPPPDGPTTPGPGGPGTPGGGGQPGGGGGGPGGPTTGGGGTPRRGPDIKPDPFPVGGGLTEPLPDPPDGKYYPGGGSQGGGGGSDGPDDPGDDGPITGGGGVGMCNDSDVDDRARTSPNDIRNSTFFRGSGSAAFAFQGRRDQIYATASSRYVGGSGVAFGTRGFDPREALGRWSGRDPHTREPESVPGLRERVGIQSPLDRGTYSLQRSLFSGFAAIAFRPQLWVQDYPNFERNPQLPEPMWTNDERVRPQTVVMRAWGLQDAALGEWDYTERPTDSRARGGTVSGGVVFSPPRFEFEDYLGIGETADVEDTSDPAATDAHVLLAPGVKLSFGQPQVTGDSPVDADAASIYRETEANEFALTFEVGGQAAMRIYINGDGDPQVDVSDGAGGWQQIGTSSPP